MKLRLSIIAAILTVCMPSAAPAQSQPGSTSETGTLINRPLAQVHGETTLDARKTLREFGICTVNRHPGQAEEVINEPVDAKDFNRKLSQIADEECFSSGELQMPPELLRAAMFEAMYLREFTAGPVDGLKSAPSFDYSQHYQRPLSDEAANTIGLAIVGDCVTRTAPSAARNLMTSMPGSPAEDLAIGVLSKQLPGCVPPNKTFRFSRSAIRGSVAEALLRLSRLTHQQASVAK